MQQVLIPCTLRGHTQERQGSTQLGFLCDPRGTPPLSTPKTSSKKPQELRGIEGFQHHMNILDGLGTIHSPIVERWKQLRMVKRCAHN